MKTLLMAIVCLSGAAFGQQSEHEPKEQSEHTPKKQHEKKSHKKSPVKKRAEPDKTASKPPAR